MKNTESNRIGNRKSNRIENCKSNQVGNGESNPIGNSELNKFGNSIQHVTEDANDSNSLGYLAYLDTSEECLR